MENDPMRSVYFTHLPSEDYAFAELYTSQVKKFLEPVVGTNAIEDIKGYIILADPEPFQGS
jgi:hypothetical protein